MPVLQSRRRILDAPTVSRTPPYTTTRSESEGWGEAKPYLLHESVRARERRQECIRVFVREVRVMPSLYKESFVESD